MRKLTFSAFVTMAVFSVAGLIHCDSDDTTEDGTGGSSSGTGGSSSGTGGSSSGTGGGSACELEDLGDDCNGLTNTATPITQVDSTDDLPTGTGGEVANGIYHTTDITAYAGSPALGSGIVLEQTWEICDGEGHLVGVDDDTSETYHKNFTLAPSGTDIGATTTCSTQVPNNEVPYSSYTATDNSLTLYSTQFGISVTLTLQ